MKHYFQRVLLPFANLISSMLPPTRCFKVRVVLYRLCGLDINYGARIVGGSNFHYKNIIIGFGSWIGSECHFYTSDSATITIGDNVDIAPNCLFNTGTHYPGNEIRRAGKNTAESIKIGDGTWICMGSIILNGTHIGSGSVVAAGAVVRGIFPNNVLLGGVPAKIIRILSN
jgi:acetyltransferase-like isoleucine patch superfamily enzyme